jgi:predicted transcriptional regulator
MSRADDFRHEFNKLEKLLRSQIDAPEYVDLQSVIKTLVNVKKDRVVTNFQNDLREYSELRNAIVHQSTNKSIAEPYEETVIALRELREKIERPKTAWDVATKNLATVKLDDSIAKVVELITKEHITSAPVLDGSEVVGFVSESTLARLIASNIEEDGTVIAAKLIRDIALDSLYGDEFDKYSYASKTLSVYEIEDMFSEAISQGKRLMAIIVTNDGKPSQSPLGIITAWDLHRIDN